MSPRKANLTDIAGTTAPGVKPIGRLERDEIRLGPFFAGPGRSAARVLRAGVHSTLHGVVFAIFVQALPCTAEGTVCRVRDTRSLAPRAYGTNRSSSNTSCSSAARAGNRVQTAGWASPR